LDPLGREPAGGVTDRLPTVLLPGRLLDEMIRDGAPGAATAAAGDPTDPSTGGRGPGADAAPRSVAFEPDALAAEPPEVAVAGLAAGAFGPGAVAAELVGPAPSGTPLVEAPEAPDESAAISEVDGDFGGVAVGDETGAEPVSDPRAALATEPAVESIVELGEAGPSEPFGADV
jgi:hypothetical protein